MRTIQIAIDGPAGSGKSTVAKTIAEKMNILYLDTGAMYRALTYYMIEKGASVQDSSALKKHLDEMQLVLKPKQVFVDGKDVTEAIRMPEVTRNVSFVAMDPYVREQMMLKQRALAGHQSVIMDGRDIGTVVLPNAEYKFFLIASSLERAKRRLIELKGRGHETDLETLVQEIETRDKMDSERAHAPLIKAEDALLIDTTTMSIEDVVTYIMAIVTK